MKTNVTLNWQKNKSILLMILTPSVKLITVFPTIVWPLSYVDNKLCFNENVSSPGYLTGENFSLNFNQMYHDPDVADDNSLTCLFCIRWQ